jgi:hypothetical protein
MAFFADNALPVRHTLPKHQVFARVFTCIFHLALNFSNLISMLMYVMSLRPSILVVDKRIFIKIKRFFFFLLPDKFLFLTTYSLNILTNSSNVMNEREKNMKLFYSIRIRIFSFTSFFFSITIILFFISFFFSTLSFDKHGM